MKTKLILADIEAVIMKEEYVKLGEKTTACILTLQNGFEIVATSSCVDPTTYNEEVGKGISKRRAMDKVWELEGYSLQVGLFNAELDCHS